MGSIPVRVTNRKKAPQKWCFFFFSCGWDPYEGIKPTRALQIKHFIALIYLFCNSSPARIWVRNIAPPLPCRKPCRAEQIPVRGISPSDEVAWVRIPGPKIDKLACQAKGKGIFICDEIPAVRHLYTLASQKRTPTRSVLFC